LGLGSQRCLVRSRVAGSYLFAACSFLGCPLSARTLFGDRWRVGGGGRASRSAWLRGGGQGATSRPWLRVTLRCVGSGTLAALAAASAAFFAARAALSAAFFVAQTAMSASRATWWASRAGSSGNQSTLIDSRAARTAADTPSCGLSRMLLQCRKKIISGYCAPRWGKSRSLRSAQQDAGALTGKSSRVVARGASMLLKQMSLLLTSRGTRIGPSSKRSSYSVREVQDLCLVRLQQNLRRICPAVVVCIARYPRWGRNGPLMCSSARLRPSCGCAVEIRVARLCSTEPTMPVSVVVTQIPLWGLNRYFLEI
jgi:hypothetical protein